MKPKPKHAASFAPQYGWIVLSGKVPLVFTIRGSRAEAIRDWAEGACEPTITAIRARGDNVIAVKISPADWVPQ